MSGSIYEGDATAIDQIDSAIHDVDPAISENAAFTAGPDIFIVNAALNRNGTSFFVQNTGTGIFTVATSRDGVVYGDEKTVEANSEYGFNGISVHSIRMTKVTNSAYSAGAV